MAETEYLNQHPSDGSDICPIYLTKIVKKAQLCRQHPLIAQASRYPILAKYSTYLNYSEHLIKWELSPQCYYWKESIYLPGGKAHQK